MYAGGMKRTKASGINGHRALALQNIRAVINLTKYRTI